MYTCKDFDCLIGLAVDGLLDGSDKAALEQHLTECAACRRKLADLTAIRAELARPVEAPENLHSSIMNALAAHEKQRKLRRLIKGFGSAAAAVVVCLMVAGGFYAMNSGMKSAEDAGFMAADAPMTSLYDSAVSYKGGANAESADLGPAEKPMPAPSPAPTAPAPVPPAADPAPAPEQAYMNLLAGEGIQFKGSYAFNLFVEGEAHMVRDLLKAADSAEIAEGYLVLEVSGDYYAVIEQLKLAGISFTEDARNGMAVGGEQPQTGLVCIKIK